MGGCPTGKFPGGFHRGRRKRGLQTDLQNEIVQEIETLLGRQAIADLDLEAVEMAVRRQALRLAARALVMEDRNSPVPVEDPQSTMVATKKPSKAYSGPCTCSGRTITVSNARADSARGTGRWGWNRFR
jgi:hypothetical protein